MSNKWIILLATILYGVSASSLSGFIDGSNYLQGESLTFSGYVQSSTAETINATVTNSSGLVTYVETTSSGGSTNSFSNSIAINFIPGTYTIEISGTTDTLSFGFDVISDRARFHAITINSTKGVVFVNTSSLRSFPDIDALSKSGAVHYGNATIGNTLYHFALVDQLSSGVYDTVYVDDDANFSLYDGGEDNGTQPMPEKILGDWDMLQGYTLLDVENSGSHILFASISETPPSVGENVTFLMAVQGSDKKLKSNYPLNVSLIAENSISSRIIKTSGNLTAETSFNLSTAGEYFLDINGSVVASVVVEPFRLIPKIMDDSGVPTFTFHKDPFVRVGVASKTLGGQAVSLSSLSAILFKPDGSKTVISSFTENPTGNYYTDVDLSGAPSGAYSIEFTGVYGGDTRKITSGFEIKSRQLDMMAINIFLMDVMDQKETTPNYFSPGSNITLATFFTDLQKGGMFGPPESWSLIKMDNVTGKRCRDILTIKEIRDSSDRIYTTNYTVVNISRMASVLGATGQQAPPTQLKDQCGIIIWGNNSLPAGAYTVQVELNYEGNRYIASDSFGIQKYYAYGFPADVGGKENWFMSPNSKVYLKTVVKNIKTNKELNLSDIKSVTITGLEKLFPVQEDVFNATHLNASYDNNTGLLKFTTPNKEGFFEIEFRFLANVTGNLTEGVGKAHIDLKKYIIFGNPYKNPMSPGKNITLRVSVFDVSQGAYLDFKGGTCTNCNGLIVNVSRIFSELSFSEVSKSRYSILSGVIMNSTNPQTNVTIVVNSGAPLETGFYGIDLRVTSPSGDEFFGWGWFEIRNFYADLNPAEYNESSGNFIIGGKNTASSGKSIYFVPTAWDPSIQSPLSISATSIKQVLKMDGFPMPVSYTGNVITGNVQTPWGLQTGVPILNISGITEDGQYDVVAEVTTSKGTDKGHGWFQISSYIVNAIYRGGDIFGAAMYSNSENLTVSFEAFANDNPHNFTQTQDCAIPKFAFRKDGREPLKINVPRLVSVWGNQCNVSFTLSGFEKGEYSFDYVLKDLNNKTKEEEVFIKIGGLRFDIPKITNAFLWDRRDPKVGAFLENSEDMCNNKLTLMYSNGTHWWQNFQVFLGGKWGISMPQTDPVNITSNGTHVWITEPNNASVVVGGGAGSVFKLNDASETSKLWEIVSVLNETIRIRHAGSKICGRYANETNGQEEHYTIISPNGTQQGYHGRINLMGDMANIKYVYAFTNGTHLWINRSADVNATSPIPLGGSFTDFWGQEWEVKKIQNQDITLYGRNVLPNGLILNTSLSQSGKFITGELQELSMGEFDPMTNQFKGTDINGNGNFSDSFLVALVDNGSRYNTLLYSEIPKGQLGYDQLNNSLYIESSPSARSFGKLTMLSIGAKNDIVRFYSKTPGDWSFLGEFRTDDVVKVPVLISYPNGTSMQGANASITRLIKQEASGRLEIALSGPQPNATTGANGVAEIQLNLSKYGIGTGEYWVEIEVNANGETEKLEEWKMPSFKVESFLYSFFFGNATYLNSTQEATIKRYQTNPRRLFTANFTGSPLPTGYPNVTKGVLVLLNDQSIVIGCPTFQEPLATGLGENHTYQFENYYFYENIANKTRVWAKKGNCNFTLASGAINASEGGEMLLELDRNYTVAVLNSTMNLTTIGVNVGSAEAVRTESFSGNPSPEWYLTVLQNVSGTKYEVLLTGGIEIAPMCNEWNTQDCIKSAYFSTNSSFAIRTLIGQNFTNDLFLSSLGPDAWSDIIIGNYSQSSIKPAMDIFTADMDKVILIKINESQQAFDFDNKPGNSTYYAAIFDGMPDGKAKYTNIMLDDDLQMTQNWFENSSDKFDFYGLENGNTREIWNNMPGEFWSGSLKFNETASWDESWQVRTLSDKGLLVQKESWNIGSNENITVVLRLFDFNQQPMTGVNVSLQNFRRFGSMGLNELNQGVDFYASGMGINVTDSKGFAVISFSPATAWQKGDYSIKFMVNSTKGVQSIDVWTGVWQ